VSNRLIPWLPSIKEGAYRAKIIWCLPLSFTWLSCIYLGKCGFVSEIVLNSLIERRPVDLWSHVVLYDFIKWNMKRAICDDCAEMIVLLCVLPFTRTFESCSHGWWVRSLCERSYHHIHRMAVMVFTYQKYRVLSIFCCLLFSQPRL
jgi:hypothetical protein